MQKQILNLTKQLIAIQTDPDRHQDLEKALELVLSHLQDFTIERFEKNGNKSALIHNRAERPEKFKIILNGHLDIIPGKPEQYKPVVKGDKLFGVGSMDMKGNVAAMVFAFKEIANKVDYPLALQIVTEEELGGFDGTLHQIEQGVNADFVISGETTNFDIVNQAKGINWLKISCKGTTAHGAYPWKGDNAIWKMLDFLQKLRQEFPIPKQQEWVTSLNLSKIETSNESFNKVPDDCTICLDMRYLPKDTGKIVRKIKKMLPKGFGLEVVVDEPALDVKKSNKYLQLLKQVTEQRKGGDLKFYTAQGSSDARHYTRVGTPGVEFGPIGGGIGTDKEWVSISSLQKFAEILVIFLMQLK